MWVAACVGHIAGCEGGRRRRMRKEIIGPPTSLSPPVTNTIPASTVLDYQSPSAKRRREKRDRRMRRRRE